MKQELREAMNRAMCGDYCYDLNCRGCEEARLLAMEQVVFARVYERWKQILGPLRVMAQDGHLPKIVVTEIAAVTQALRQETKL